MKVFIDGRSGTTGLRIEDRLKQRSDIELIEIPYENRHDPDARAQAMNQSDVVFLCLPDAAAEEAAAFVTNPDTVVIDTSTAHRTADGWVYGLAEIQGQKERIVHAKRISNPGCHATGFIALIEPLIQNGILDSSTVLSFTSITGYSGGGKKMIAQYEQSDDPLLKAPRLYGLNQNHKHLAEMKKICHLDHAPLFMPVAADYFSGMETIIPLDAGMIHGSADDIRALYQNIYKGPVIHYEKQMDENGYMSAAFCSGYDDMEVSVYGNQDRIVLTARFDNLGKGASGAAIQNMNLAMGMNETAGLVLEGKNGMD